MSTGTVHSFQHDDGLTLSWQQWLPESAKASLLISHGYAEHAGRYAHFADFLTAHGYAVYALDHRGHGKSEGERANIQRFEQFVQDYTVFTEHLEARGLTQPCFLFGHSMGGIIASKVAFKHAERFKGLILSAPFLENATHVPAILTTLSGLVSRFLPSLGVNKLDSKLICTDANVVKAYDDDPLVYSGATKARLGAEMLTAGPEVIQQAKQLTIPLLLMHGTADQIASPDGSRQLYSALELEDKTFKTYDGFYHEILNEIGKEVVYQDVLKWMDIHLS